MMRPQHRFCSSGPLPASSPVAHTLVFMYAPFETILPRQPSSRPPGARVADIKGNVGATRGYQVWDIL